VLPAHQARPVEEETEKGETVFSQQPATGGDAPAPGRQPPASPQDTPADSQREVPTPAPISKGPLIWRNEEGVAQALRSAFTDGVEVALHLAQMSREEPAASLHRFRKTVRRLKALARLSRPLIDGAAHRSLQRRLSSAMELTSRLRDDRVLPVVLAALPDRKKTRTARKALAELLDQRVEEIERSQLEESALAVSGLALRRLPDRLASALPDSTREEELAIALGSSHRRLRKAAGRALESDDPQQIHLLRRRVKELRYQSELLLPLAVPEMDPFLAILDEVAAELGEITNLFILEEAVRTHRQALKKSDRKALRRSLERLWQKRWRRLEEPIETLLYHRPKRVGAFIWPERS